VAYIILLFGISGFGLIFEVCALMSLLVSRLLSGFCRLLLLPYELTRFVGKPAALERTFLLLGVLLVATGIALCAWTLY
jgi:hypothetical protein